MDPPLGELVQTSQLHGPLCEEEEQQPNCWDFACADVVSGRCVHDVDSVPLSRVQCLSQAAQVGCTSDHPNLLLRVWVWQVALLTVIMGDGAAKNPGVHLDDTPLLLIRCDICGKRNVRNIDKNLVEGPKPVLVDPNTHIGRRLARNKFQKSSVMETKNY